MTKSRKRMKKGWNLEKEGKTKLRKTRKEGKEVGRNSEKEGRPK